MASYGCYCQPRVVFTYGATTSACDGATDDDAVKLSASQSTTAGGAEAAPRGRPLARQAAASSGQRGDLHERKSLLEQADTHSPERDAWDEEL